MCLSWSLYLRKLNTLVKTRINFFSKKRTESFLRIYPKNHKWWFSQNSEIFPTLVTTLIVFSFIMNYYVPKLPIFIMTHQFKIWIPTWKEKSNLGHLPISQKHIALKILCQYNPMHDIYIMSLLIHK